MQEKALIIIDIQNDTTKNYKDIIESKGSQIISLNALRELA